MNYKKISLHLLVFSLICLPTIAMAAVKLPSTGNLKLGEVIQSVVNYVMAFAGSLAMLFLMYAGVKYLTASSEDAATEAKQQITNAVIGIIIIAASWGIVNLIISFLGFLGIKPPTG